MTNNNKQTQKTGNRPTHGLFIKSEQFGNPINVRFSAIWNNQEKGYMSLSPEKLGIRENPNAGPNEPRFQLFLKTKIYGQDAEVQIGSIIPEKEENCFALNLGDLVIFENKPRGNASKAKGIDNGQPSL